MSTYRKKVDKCISQHARSFTILSQDNNNGSDFSFRSLALERRSPWLSQNLTNQAVNSSSTLTLPCKALGVPHPEIMWYKNGVAVKEGPGNDGAVLKSPISVGKLSGGSRKSFFGFFCRKVLKHTLLEMSFSHI